MARTGRGNASAGSGIARPAAMIELGRASRASRASFRHAAIRVGHEWLIAGLMVS
jgi:hypothetical protein